MIQYKCSLIILKQLYKNEYLMENNKLKIISNLLKDIKYEVFGM